MRKPKIKKPLTHTTIGAKTAATAKDFFPMLPPDDPIFKQGWIVGQTFSGASPKDARRQNDGAARRSTPRQLTEEEIRAELDRMRDAGYGTVGRSASRRKR